jgi:Spy/CpxP family protein refolding chaperone
MIMGHMMRGLGELDLAQNQQEKISRIVDRSREKDEAQRTAAANATSALTKAIFDGSGEESIKRIAARLGSVIAQGAVEKAAMIAAVKDVLNADQLKKLNRIHQNIGSQAEGQRGRGQGPEADDDRGPDRDSRERGQRPSDQDRGERGDRPQGERPDRGQMLERLFENDTNNDGKLTKKELENSDIPFPIDRLFERADTNGDGALTKEELESSRPQGGPGGDRGPGGGRGQGQGGGRRT